MVCVCIWRVLHVAFFFIGFDVLCDVRVIVPQLLYMCVIVINVRICMSRVRDVVQVSCFLRFECAVIWQTT